MDDLIHYVERRRDIINPFTGEVNCIASRGAYTRDYIFRLKQMNLNIDEFTTNNVIKELNLKYHSTLLGYYKENYEKHKNDYEKKQISLSIDVDFDEYVQWTISAAIMDIVTKRIESKYINCYMTPRLLYVIQRYKIFNFQPVSAELYNESELEGKLIIEFIDIERKKQKYILDIYKTEYMKFFDYSSYDKMICLFIDQKTDYRYFKMILNCN